MGGGRPLAPDEHSHEQRRASKPRGREYDFRPTGSTSAASSQSHRQTLGLGRSRLGCCLRQDRGGARWLWSCSPRGAAVVKRRDHRRGRPHPRPGHHPAAASAPVPRPMTTCGGARCGSSPLHTRIGLRYRIALTRRLDPRPPARLGGGGDTQGRMIRRRMGRSTDDRHGDRYGDRIDRTVPQGARGSRLEHASRPPSPRSWRPAWRAMARRPSAAGSRRGGPGRRTTVPAAPTRSHRRTERRRRRSGRRAAAPRPRSRPRPCSAASAASSPRVIEPMFDTLTAGGTQARPVRACPSSPKLQVRSGYGVRSTPHMRKLR